MIKKYINRSLFMGIILGLILSIMIIPTFANVTEYIFTQSSWKLMVDNKPYANPDIPINLFIKDGSNCIPLAVLRDLCLKLNIPFDVNSATKEIRITTTNTAGKEETALMSETVSATNTVNNTVNTYNEGDLVITEVNGEKYIEFLYVMGEVRKAKYIISANGSGWNILNSNNEILGNIPQHLNGVNNEYFPTNEFYIKYSDYQSIVKPILGE